MIQGRNIIYRSIVWAFVLLPALVLSLPAFAQEVTIDLGQGGQLSGRVFQLIALVTVLSLAPAILIMMTSFTRIVVVLSLLRSALGVQQTPPNTVIISLALFLTFFVMQPTLNEAYDKGIAPLIAEEIDERTAMERAGQPFHDFMVQHVRQKDLIAFLDIAGIELPSDTKVVPYRVLIPAFIISELRRAFEIGFLIFIPFLIIDMVIASVLMSMGMMMLPPIMIALPFKLVFFVLVDGWALVSTSLIKSFG